MLPLYTTWHGTVLLSINIIPHCAQRRVWQRPKIHSNMALCAHFPSFSVTAEFCLKDSPPSTSRSAIFVLFFLVHAESIYLSHARHDRTVSFVSSYMPWVMVIMNHPVMQMQYAHSQCYNVSVCYCRIYVIYLRRFMSARWFCNRIHCTNACPCMIDTSKLMWISF